jgi:uncharacterized integral membrane protein (TIGR00698 family)
MKKEVLPGLGLAAVIAVAAYMLNMLPFAPFTMPGKDPLHPQHPLESVLLAILLGLLVNNLIRLPKSIAPGAKYCLKSVLALGIVLMGSKLDFFDVIKLGGLSVGLVVIVIGVALSVSLWFGKLFGLRDKLGALIAVGCTICGGSAIAATSPAIEAEDSDVTFAVGTITILGLAAMFLYPAIAASIGLTNVGFGFWAGTAIHNTPQVVAAGVMHSPVSGEVATTVKMTRNLFIAPIVVLFGYLFRSRRAAGKKVKLNYRELFPMFVLGFVLMALLRTALAHYGLVGSAKAPMALWPAYQYLDVASVWLITIAMAGIGLTTNLGSMKKLGAGGFAVGLITTMIVASVSALLIFSFHINGVAFAAR